MSHAAVVGQIWQDDCYYFDSSNGQCKRKYVLILAVDSKTGDSVTVVFTSQPNGLTEKPSCCIGVPRSGFYLGILGGAFCKETWLDFNSLKTLDAQDLSLHIKQGQKILLKDTLASALFCSALRCVMQMQEDITKQQWQLLGDTIENLNCA